MVRPTLSGFIEVHCYYYFFQLFEFPLLFYLLLKLSLIFDHLPSAYLLVHNCETSRGPFVFPFVITLVL